MIPYPCRNSKVNLQPFRRRFIFRTPAIFVWKIDSCIFFTAFLIPFFRIRGRCCYLPVLNCTRYHAQGAIRHAHWKYKKNIFKMVVLSLMYLGLQYKRLNSVAFLSGLSDICIVQGAFLSHG